MNDTRKEKNYLVTSLLAMLIAWLAMLATHALWSIYKYGSIQGGDTAIIAFWSLLFSLLFYYFFIVLPRKYVKIQGTKRTLLAFSLGSAIYALAGFIVLIGWLFFTTDFYGVFLDAFVGGLFFGLSFWILWNR